MELSEGFGFKPDDLKKILALLIRNNEFFEKFGSWMKSAYFSTADPGAPNDAMSEIFDKAKDYYLSHNGALIPDREILKREVLEHFKQFKKNEKELVEWYDLVDEIFDRTDLDSIKDYYAEAMRKVIQFQEVKLLFHKFIDDSHKGPFDPQPSLIELVGNGGRLIDLGSAVIISPEAKIQSLVFPSDVIQGFVKEFADLYSEYLESPYEFWVFDAFTFLGAVFATRVRIPSAISQEARLYTIGIGTSASTRKSESGTQSDYFIRDILRVFTNLVEDKKSVKTVREDDKKFFKSSLFSMSYGCGSAEGVFSCFQKGSRNLLLFYDEFSTLMKKTQLKGAALIELVSSLFEKTWQDNTLKGKIQRIEDVHLSLLAFTTSDLWEEMFDRGAIKLGFLNRVWIVPGVGQRKDFNPDEIPSFLKSKLKTYFLTLLTKYPINKKTSITIEKKADMMLDSWYRDALPDDDASRRLDGYARRFLQLMAISERKTHIDEDMVKRVFKLIDWQIKARRLYEPISFASQMARVENVYRKVILAHRNGILLDRAEDLIKAHQFDFAIREKALSNLIKKDEITEQTSYKGGILVRKLIPTKKLLDKLEASSS